MRIIHLSSDKIGILLESYVSIIAYPSLLQRVEAEQPAESFYFCAGETRYQLKWRVQSTMVRTPLITCARRRPEQSTRSK